MKLNHSQSLVYTLIHKDSFDKSLAVPEPAKLPAERCSILMDGIPRRAALYFLVPGLNALNRWWPNE